MDPVSKYLQDSQRQDLFIISKLRRNKQMENKSWKMTHFIYKVHMALSGPICCIFETAAKLFRMKFHSEQLGSYYFMIRLPPFMHYQIWYVIMSSRLPLQRMSVTWNLSNWLCRKQSLWRNFVISDIFERRHFYDSLVCYPKRDQLFKVEEILFTVSINSYWGWRQKCKMSCFRCTDSPSLPDKCIVSHRKYYS